MASRITYWIDVTWSDRVQSYHFPTKKAWDEAYSDYLKLNSVRDVVKYKKYEFGRRML